MKIKLSKTLALAIGKALLKPYGIDREFDRLSYTSHLELDLNRFGAMKLLALKKIIEGQKEAKGAKANIRDITTYVQGLVADAKDAVVNTAQQYAALLERFLLKVPGHRVYQRNEDAGVWEAYYVGKVEYHPPERGRGYTSPAYTTITMFYEEFGKIEQSSRSWYLRDIKGKTVQEILTASELYPETDELRAEYLVHATRFRENVNNIGKQFLARGDADDDLDGNPRHDRDSWWRRTATIRLDKDGEPSRVVIDVFQEGEEKRGRDRDATINHDYWVNIAKGTKRDDNDDEYDADIESENERLEAGEDAADDSAVNQEEVPLHPTMAVFDLKRHLRLRVNMAQLEDYTYDATLGDKLILPDDDRLLVDTLLKQATADTFQDVVSGKSGGHIIMCAGVPGTGKTLTAEVYAEVAQRPLYSVQCSQLGTTPDELEDELLKVLARGARWNAITLLDEADVYVAERGRDLNQNAIVGVFLRVLEYYKGVMFLTTNRAEMVDDAIASRCVARVLYTTPTPENQKRIWRALAEQNTLTIADKDIQKIVEAFPALTGRDVKNLLKLSTLNSSKVTFESVKFAKRFKPTKDTRIQEGV